MEKYMRPVIMSVIIIALAGCDQSPDYSETAGYRVADTSPLFIAKEAVQSAETENFIAYRYTLGVQVPADAVEPLHARHVKECANAGLNCRLIDSRVQQDGFGRTTAYVTFRLLPAEASGFAAKLTAEAEALGGALTENSVSSNDLSRSVIDTRAQLEAKTKLRDRLLALLDNAGSTVGDLVEVERELARVQGEIDSATSLMAHLRAQIDMSAVEINYYSEPQSIDGGTSAPITGALRSFISVMANSLGHVITFLAATIPWLPLILGAGWLLRWAWRKWRVRKAG